MRKDSLLLNLLETRKLQKSLINYPADFTHPNKDIKRQMKVTVLTASANTWERITLCFLIG